MTLPTLSRIALTAGAWPHAVATPIPQPRPAGAAAKSAAAALENWS
ncbi:hypothetical protein HMPREF9946_00906 [Acetobacteraceae bacterium AT-5844]|nr:hypothetical protein HMPREF9946_00906 [Acetobacteraceae bacterium AT-5844]